MPQFPLVFRAGAPPDVAPPHGIRALGDQAPKVQLGEATNNPDRDRAFATSALRAQGFDRLYNLEGGIALTNWSDATSTRLSEKNGRLRASAVCTL